MRSWRKGSVSAFQADGDSSNLLLRSKINILRRVAVVAKRSHKPTVPGSNPGARNNIGRLGEWFKPADLKSADLKGSVRSNRTSSALNIFNC